MTLIRILVLGLTLTATLSGVAADGQADRSATANEAQPAKGADPAVSRQELETKFKATLTEATMSGRWCSINKGKLGPEKEDKYTIVSISKVQGDSWVIRARIQYGKVDMVAPIPVQVKWAGD